jgi:hypothetical protein
MNKGIQNLAAEYYGGDDKDQSDLMIVRDRKYSLLSNEV